MTETLRGITRLSVLLVVLFAISFSIPVLLGLRIGGWGSGGASSEGEPSTKDLLFPDAVEFSNPRAELRIKGSESLLPDAEHDTVIASWFKLKKLPQDGQRLFLVSKIESAKSDSFGYVLAVTRDRGTIRPAIYWRNSSKQGGWYTFSEVTIAPDSWFMLGVGFYEQRYLGVYLGSLIGGEFNLQLAGGYDLEQATLPDGSAELVVGAQPGNEIFRAFAGPLCMARAEGIKDELRSLFKKIVKDPSSMVRQFDHDDLQFCTTDWRSDLSPNNLSIEAKNFGDRAARKR